MDIGTVIIAFDEKSIFNFFALFNIINRGSLDTGCKIEKISKVVFSSKANGFNVRGVVFFLLTVQI